MNGRSGPAGTASHRQAWEAIARCRLDGDHSPYTGLRRPHWEAAADMILDGAWQHRDRGGGLLCPPGSHSRSGARSDGLEGFARTFLLAAFRIRGSNGLGVDRFVDRYSMGVRIGSDQSRHDSRWPMLDETSQAIVEAASIALSLNLTRRWIWDALDERSQDRICTWLTPGLAPPPVNNNWHLFPLAIAGFLESVDRGSVLTSDAVDRALEQIEPWHDGAGWYSDGPGRAYDHYTGWAMHFYPVLHAYLSSNGELLSRYGPRLREFLRSYALLFDTNGAPVFFGRSLIYRFAAVAPLWLGCLTGFSPWEPGTARRIASGALRYFVDGGAVSGGVLSLGWLQAGDMPIQRYSGPASPNWAAKAFVGLLISPEDDEWNAVEQPAPVERGDFCSPLGRTGLLAQGTVADGIVRLHNHGSDIQRNRQSADTLDNPFYSQAAYSTRTVPTWLAPHSNSFGLLMRSRQTERGPIDALGTGYGWARSRNVPYRRWFASPRFDRPRIRAILPAVRPVRGTTVEYIVCCHGTLELRIWRVLGSAGATFRASGWPIAAARRTSFRNILRSNAFGTRVDIETDLQHSGMYGRIGFERGKTVIKRQRSPYGAFVAFPEMTGRCGGDRSIFVAIISLASTPGPDGVDDVIVEQHDDVLTVTWADGIRQDVTFSGVSSDDIEVRTDS
jgi:hypothetical protein